MYHPVSKPKNEYNSTLKALKKLLTKKGYEEVGERNYHLRPDKNFFVQEGTDFIKGKQFQIKVSFKETPTEYFFIRCFFGKGCLQEYFIMTSFSNAGYYSGKLKDYALDFATLTYQNLRAELLADVKSALKRKTIASWKE